MFVVKGNAGIVQHVYTVLKSPVEIKMQSGDKFFGQKDEDQFYVFEFLFVKRRDTDDVARNGHYKGPLLHVVCLQIEIYTEVAFLQEENYISVKSYRRLERGQYLGVAKSAFSACLTHYKVSAK